jgi:hypothetical protein
LELNLIEVSVTQDLVKINDSLIARCHHPMITDHHYIDNLAQIPGL